MLVNTLKVTILRWIFQSPLGSLYFNLQDWWELRSIKALAAKKALMARGTAVAQRNLIQQAIRRLKDGLKRDYSLEDLKTGKVNNIEIDHYATGNNAQMAEIMRKIYVYEGKDVKNEADYQKMIHTRISHYEQLHKATERREMIRRIRKETNPNLKAELEKEFKERYLK
jgi:hypothetical protein